MPRPADRPHPGELLRFTLAERWVHRSTAVLMGVCLVTAAVLYVGPLSVAVGRRALVEQVHIWCGIALPVPFLLGLLSAAVRTDAGRLGRFSPTDWAWLRARDRRVGRLSVGKFNAGQKLNANVLTGASLVLLGTGLIMRWGNALGVAYRTGATFVHDWFAAGVLLLVLGHLTFAARDPVARHGMRRGLVPLPWARREHRGWAEEQLEAPEPAAADRAEN